MFDCEVLNLPEATAGDLESKEKGMDVKGKVGSSRRKNSP